MHFNEFLHISRQDAFHRHDMAPIAHVTKFQLFGTSRVEGDAMSMFYRDCRYLALYPDADQVVAMEISSTIPVYQHDLHFVLAGRNPGDVGVSLDIDMYDYVSKRWVQVGRKRVAERDYEVDLKVNGRMVRAQDGETRVRLTWIPDTPQMTHVDIDTVAWYARKSIAA